MSARRRWQALNYGPGVLIVVIGVVGFVATGRIWSLAFAFLGFTLAMQTLSSVHLYKSAYFRGRGDQLRDLANGRWPDPAKIDPAPWDDIA